MEVAPKRILGLQGQGTPRSHIHNVHWKEVTGGTFQVDEGAFCGRYFKIRYLQQGVVRQPLVKVPGGTLFESFCFVGRRKLCFLGTFDTRIAG